MNLGMVTLISIMVVIVVISILPPGITILAVLMFLVGSAISESIGR